MKSAHLIADAVSVQQVEKTRSTVNQQKVGQNIIINLSLQGLHPVTESTRHPEKRADSSFTALFFKTI